MPIRFTVTSVDEAARILTSLQLRTEFTHLVSIGDQDNISFPRPCNLEALSMPYLRLEFDDIHHLDSQWIHPTWQDVNSLIEFLRSIPGDANVLFHCHMGRSRSTAAALIYACIRTGSEEDAMKMLLEKRPQAHPNRLMLMIADSILNSRLLVTAKSILGDRGYYLESTIPSIEELNALGLLR